MTYKDEGENKVPDLHLKLTDDQRRQIVEFIAKTRHAKLDIELLYEANVEQHVVAPASVLVGNAI